MKTIDLATTNPTLNQLLNDAGEDNVILQTSDGRRFVIAEIDNFAEEVAKVRANKKLMQFLDQRSKDKTGIPLDEVRKQLGLKRKSRKKD